LTTDTAIFDAAPYTTPKASIDGNQADEIAVKFGGTWEPSVEFFDGLRLGQTVTLTIEAEVIGMAASIKSDGDDVAIVGTAKVKVIDVYAPAPEDLG
jgi:hypothetical protein